VITLKRNKIKRIIKYGILFLILIGLTNFVYHLGKNSYEDYLHEHENDVEWVRDNTKLVENYRIGNDVLVPIVPTNYDVNKELYHAVIQEKIDDLLISSYSITNPLIIYNPFFSDKGSINLYFQTGEEYSFEYYITTESIASLDEVSYTTMLDSDGIPLVTRKHYYVLKGFTPGKRNNLVIRILDSSNNVVDVENFILNIPNKK